MNKTTQLGISFCLLLVFVSGFANTESDQSKASAELSDLRKQIHSLQDDLGQIRNQYKKNRAELKKEELKIGKLIKAKRHTQRKLKIQSRKLNKLKKKQTHLGVELLVQRELLMDQVYTSYALGRQEYLKLLLNQEDPALLGRVVIYYKYFNRARSKRIENTQQTLVKLDKVQQSITKEAQTLTNLKKQQEKEERALQTANDARTRVIAKLNKAILSKGNELTRLLEDERRLSRLIQHIRTEAISTPPIEQGKRQVFAKLKGKLKWPTKGKVNAVYGKLRNAGKVKWNGVMINAKQGAEVRVISHGRVAFADWLRGYGLLIIIDHGNGYMSLYGHNQSLYRETGDWVDTNEPIASVGDTGGQQLSGLYFEIRHNGRPTNPTRWCKNKG